MDTRPGLGRCGEDAACGVYEQLGFEIVERNHRCSLGEIDVIARRGNLLVFCEVKTRRTDRWGDPSEAVHPRKQARLRRLAGHWLATNAPGSVSVRFDVVSVIVRDGRTEVEHLPDAF